MGKRIDPDSVEGKGRGAPRKYPWDEWMDGSCWLLNAGVDYTTATRVFQATVFKHAERHGYTVSTKQVEGGIAIQFTKPEPEESEKKPEESKKED
jgi:hypothetical protein